MADDCETGSSPVLTSLSDPLGLTRVLLDGMAEGVSLTAEDGTLVYTNPAEDRMFGYELGELVGRHVSVQNAYPADENARIVGEVIATLKRSRRWEGEWLNRRKDGTPFVTRTRITAVEVNGTRLWLCLREDEAGREAAERALRESQARLELATKAAEVGIWDWDLMTNRMTFSDRAKAISGLPLDREVTFDAVRATVHPEDHPRTSAQAHRALDPALRDRSPYEYRIVLPDGSVRWVLAQGEAVFAEVEGETKAIRYLGTIQDITRRRALEDAQRLAAARLQLAIDAGRMAIWEVDMVRDSLIGSPELSRLLGFPEDHPLAIEEVRRHHFPGERERLQAIGRAATARGDRFIEADFRFVRPDGTLRWLLLRCEIAYAADGTPLRALGVMSDVTDTKRAEEDLRASEARLQLASAAARAGVWDMDLLTGKVVWSDEEYALHDVDREAPAGALHEVWLSRLHPEDRDSVVSRQDRAAAKGGGFSQDYRIIRRDGTLRWIRTHVTTVPGPFGRSERMVGIEMDVTDELRATEALKVRSAALEDELAERQRTLDRFYALSNDLFAVAGFDGYLKAINPAWSRLLGLSEAELLARPFAEFIHPDDRAAGAEVIARLADGEAIHRFEVRLVRADGGAVWVAWAAVAEGALFYAVGRDITRDREREAILRQSQKMEAVGQLTGGIAHDFNNLLQALQGSLELIAKRPEDAARVSFLAEQGLQAARRGGSLTAQLLAFSRAQRLEVAAVSPALLLAGLSDLLRTSLAPMIELVLDFAEDAPAVLADATQVEMAVLNCAINARDAMPGGGRVTIGAAPLRLGADPELPPGDYVALTIADDGPGMPAEVAQRAFEPFFTTKAVGKGTGLGLAQVYGMARQSGGTARLVSEPGRGTTVTVILRRAPAASAGPRGVPGDVTDAPAAGETVLVVDDDPPVRRWLAGAVAELGYGVLVAEDGAAALDLLGARPDLLLVDYAMPAMTGAELARAARARYPGLPVVFATGYADTAEIETVEGASVLRKPFGSAELAAALRAALRLQPK